MLDFFLQNKTYYHLLIFPLLSLFQVSFLPVSWGTRKTFRGLFRGELRLKVSPTIPPLLEGSIDEGATV